MVEPLKLNGFEELPPTDRAGLLLHHVCPL